MTCGVITTIPPLAPSIRTCFACAKSWRKILPIRCTSGQYTAQATSLSGDGIPGRRPGMGRLRLRTKFLIAMLLTSAGLTAVSLLIVQRTVENQVRRELGSDLANSVETFRNLQHEREAELARSAELMADLPSLKALMTSRHAPTIQDASGEMFRLSGGDLFALIDSSNEFVGFHTKAPGISREQAEGVLQHHNALDEPLQWWFANGHLYEVVLKPIYFGRQADNALLGVVAVGYEMNATVAREVGQIAASQVAIVCGRDVVVSTLNSEQTNELRSHLTAQALPQGPTDWKFGKEDRKSV